MSKVIHKEKERGQIIVLLAVSVVVVMVVAALAVDGGMIYSERRFAQNAADSAAFAGGGAIYNSGDLDESLVCPTSSSDNLITTIVSQAQARAFANNISELDFKGYEKNNPEFEPDENQGIWVVCNDNTDPKTIDVIVRVTSQVSTAFAHLIYPGPLQTTNEAVVTVSQKGAKSSGDAIISLGPGCGGGNGGIILDGNPDELIVIQSGAFSNSCLQIGSNLNKIIEVDDGFKIHGDVDGKSGHYDIIKDKIYKGYTKISTKNLDENEPVCDESKIGSFETKNGIKHYKAGYYEGGLSFNKGDGSIVFDPGLYCIKSGLHFNGGTGKKDDVSIQGVGVTFYLYDGATFSNNGGLVKLVAPMDPSKPNYGLLFFIKGDVDVTWQGSNVSHFNGLFYAPKAKILFTGNANNKNGTCPDIQGVDCEKIKFPTQFIGHQITFKASSSFNIDNTDKYISSLQNNLFLKD